jgi:hypothetical protein
MIAALRLRYVQVVDFRRSEATNFEEFAKKEKELLKTFRGNDCVLFVSEAGSQLVFVYGINHVDEEMKNGFKVDRQIVASSRLRLLNGRWSPTLLRHYAESVGLDLVNVRSFDEISEEQRKHRAEERRKAA